MCCREGIRYRRDEYEAVELYAVGSIFGMVGMVGVTCRESRVSIFNLTVVGEE